MLTVKSGKTLAATIRDHFGGAPCECFKAKNHNNRVVSILKSIPKSCQLSQILLPDMSAFSPTQMYAQQAVAYSSRDSLLGETTNSTPESPPTQTPPDIERLCELRRHVLRNLPTTCSHCKAEMLKDDIVDHKGSIIAYCKTPGACGRSLVLYAGVDFSYPVYEQTCPYKYTPPAAAPTAIPTSFTDADIVPVEAAPLDLAELTQQIQQHASRLPTDQTGALDIYALHGIPNPAHMCDTCGRGPDVHKKCDQNGWYEVRRQHYTLPANWPRYDSSTKTWTNVE